MLQLSFGEKESFGVWIPHCGRVIPLILRNARSTQHCTAFGEKLNWLKGSSVEGRKEGRRTERGNYWGRNPVRVRVNPSPRVALCRIDNREVDANFSFCQNTSGGFSIRQIWTSANSYRLVKGYVLPYLKIKRVKNSQELHFTNIFHKLTFDYYD